MTAVVVVEAMAESRSLLQAELTLPAPAKVIDYCLNADGVVAAAAVVIEWSTFEHW